MVRLKVRLIDIMTILYLTVAITMITSSSENAMKVNVAFLALWMVTAFLTSTRKIYKAICNKICISILLYFFCIILVGMVSWNLFYNFKTGIGVIIQFSPILILLYYIWEDQKSLIKMSKFLVFVWLVLCIYSIYLANTYDEIGRQVTAGSSQVDGFAVGGVTMANGAILMGVYFLEYIRKGNAKTRKGFIFCLIVVAIQFVTVIVSGSTISVVCMIAAAILLFVPQKNKVIAGIILLIAILALIIFRSEIGEFIIGLAGGIEDRTSAARIRSLGYAIAYGTTNAGSTYFFDRIDRPLLSLRTFLENPIFGVAYKYGNYYPDAYSYGVGCHGEWADALAKFGIFSIPFFAIFVRTFRFYIRRYKTDFPCWAFAWILAGCFNPVVSVASVAVAFLIIPSIQESIQVEKFRLHEKNFIYK